MDRFYVGATDIETLGCITSWDGILSEGPYAGDLIEFDWTAGAVWQQGERKTYSFSVPLQLAGPELYQSIAALNTLKGWHGTSQTLTRKFPSGMSGNTLTYTQQTCTAVLVSEINPVVTGGRFILVPLVWQNLSGKWT